MFLFIGFIIFPYRKFVSPPIFPRSKQCRTSLSKRSSSRIQLAHVGAENSLKSFPPYFVYVCRSFSPNTVTLFQFNFIFSSSFLVSHGLFCIPGKLCWILSFLSHGYSSFVIALLFLTALNCFYSYFLQLCSPYFILFHRKELLFLL